jgi:hypothetical protein
MMQRRRTIAAGGSVLIVEVFRGHVSQGNGVQAVPSHDDLERAIRSVPGVAEATVARAADTGRGRLRIRLHPGEDPDRVSWSVAATLRERFDIALDPAEIRPRLAALSETGPADDQDPGDTTAARGAGPVDAPGPATRADAGRGADRSIVLETTGPVGAGGEDAADLASSRTRLRAWRPAIRDLGSRNDGVALTVTASLELDGRVASGEATGTPTTRGLHRAIAEATLSALGQLTTSPLRAEIDRVTVVDADPASVTVVVSLLSDRGEELLMGASIVRGDIEHAVMRAALDAVNRRVEPSLALEA